MNVEAELAARLATAPEVRFAVLFGSRSGRRPRVGSDWDVGVYLDEDLTPRETFKARLRIAGGLEDLGRIDLVVLNDAPPLLAHRALQGKRLLLRDKPAYVRYFRETLAASEDERHWRDIHLRARLARARTGRFGRP